jgi:adenylate cyclase
MKDAKVAELSAWITEAGLTGLSEGALLRGFCERLVAAGMRLARVTVVIDTLHPIHEGRAFRWRRGEGDPVVVEYGRTHEGNALANWQRSPFYHLLQNGGSELRRCLCAGDPADFPIVAEHHAEGMTDYLALVNRFAADGAIGEMDCVYSSWLTDGPDGFGEGGVAALRRLAPFLALAVKCASLTRIAETLVETYLGRDAGRRVLSGRIERGVADRIDAVLWFSDLQGFTRITDSAPPEQIIPFLNDYHGAVVSAVHDGGGDVLKLIGDGTLAIFTADDRGTACRSALAAAKQARRRVAELNRRRADEDLPTSRLYLGLHVGEVFYGNVGSENRLDFTVVGPAVNEVSRIAAMCRSADCDLLLSAAFADAFHQAAPEAARRGILVSVGRYALRGVGRAQELFTLDPGLDAVAAAERGGGGEGGVTR